MGNCCSATPTSEGPVFGVSSDREYEPATSHHQHHQRQNSQQSVSGGGGGVVSDSAAGGGGGGGGVGVSSNGGVGGGNMTPDSLSTPAEPQQLEHMADREDLTNKEGTMFLEKSKNARKLMKNGRSRTYAGRKRHSSARLSYAGRHGASPLMIKKANSCSTIFTDDSTVSQPNLKSSLKCVSLAVFYHIKNRDRDREPHTMSTFDEKLHPLTREEVPAHYGDYTPDHKVIYKFIKTLFHAAQLTAECAIITLIYLERLLHYSELDLHPSNWKRILLGGILLASKVWDDQAVWNVDYCQILRDITVEDMNELERIYLEQLQFNINVLSSVYAKYYFDLRSLAEDNGLVFPSDYEPLTHERAKKLEAVSEDKFVQHKHKLKKSSSLEPLSPKNITILM